MRKYRLLLTTILVVLSVLGFSQTEKLNPYSAEYFTKSQVDTLSQKFIIAQNYIVLYSWGINIQKRQTQRQHTSLKRDTIDIKKQEV